MLTFSGFLNCKHASRAFLIGQLENGFVALSMSPEVAIFGPHVISDSSPRYADTRTWLIGGCADR
jgi:hypothetical protein